MVTNLANHWAAAGRRIAVITFADTDADYFALDPRVDRIISGGVGASHSVIGAATANLRRIKALRASLRNVRASTALAFIGATNVLTILAAAGLGLTVIISERNDPARQSLGRPWDILRRLVYRYADLVTANSKSALATLANYVPDRKLRLAHNPVLAPDPLPERAPEPMILTVGRLVPQKSQSELVDAFAQIAPEFPDWTLMIVGDGPDEKRLKAQATDLGLSDRITFAGRTDPWPFYARASIFALATQYEGTSNALLEAMTMGVPPVVSSASGGDLGLVVDGEDGLVTSAHTENSLVEVLRKLATDADLRRQLGRAAANEASKFDLATVVGDWEKLVGLAPASGLAKSDRRHQSA